MQAVSPVAFRHDLVLARGLRSKRTERSMQMKLLFTCLISIAFLIPVATARSEDTAAKLTPQTQNGVHFVSGGVGKREQAAIDEMQSDYNVRVTLSDPAGRYLTGVELSIETNDGKRLVQTTTKGPIFLAKLDAGRYALRASQPSRMTERRVFDVPHNRKEHVRLFVTMPKEAPE
jgi:hypothetical protein